MKWVSRLRSVVDCVLGRSLPQASPQSDGARAEALAAKFLAQRGLKILSRNFRSKGGEIDLIAEHGAFVVFVEVRLRQRSDYGGAAGSISAAKQRRILLAARFWLQTQGQSLAHHPCRFDAILLDRVDDARIEWLQGAFSADGIP